VHVEVGDGVGLDGYGGVHEDLVVLGVLVVRDRRTGRHHAGRAESVEQLAEQRLDDRADVLPVVALGEGAELGDPGRGDAFQDDVVGGHVTFLLDQPEPRLDTEQPGRALGQLLLELCLPQPQHAAQFLRGQLGVDDLVHLLQAEAEILERDDPVQPAELVRRVVAVPGRLVDDRRPEQPDRVVVPEHPGRHLPERREVPDGEHATTFLLDTVSRSTIGQEEPAGRAEGAVDQRAAGVTDLPE
jgi:hypothetical protein